MNFHPSMLNTHIHTTGDGVTLELVGEASIATEPELAAALQEAAEQAMAAQAARLTVDLRGVELIDSVGLASLIRARRRLVPEGRALHLLLTAGGQPDRVLRLGRFDTIMTLVYDTDARDGSS